MTERYFLLASLILLLWSIVCIFYTIALWLLGRLVVNFEERLAVYLLLSSLLYINVSSYLTYGQLEYILYSLLFL